jgi:SHS2 domain-containing protein
MATGGADPTGAGARPGPASVGAAAGDGGFELLEHTADVGIRAWGATLEAAFEQATLGLAEVLGAVRPGPGQPVTLEVSAADHGGLLVDWLNEVLWLQEVRQAAVAGVRVARVALDEPDGGGAGADDPGPGGGEGVARGVVELADGGSAPDGTFVKAVTYHRLRVEREPGGGWIVEVYLDV